MVVAVILGALAGVVGFLPLFLALRPAGRMIAGSTIGPMAVLMMGLLVSFVILILAAVGCIAIDKSLGFPFVIAEAVALSVCAIGFGVSKTIRR